MQRTIFFAVSLVLLATAPPEALRELPGLLNVHKASETVFLGSEPEGEEAFASLQKLGITTVVSVDGATPDVATAKQFGIRYIHIPIGYDGIPDDAAKALTRVAREIQSPVYVHCHHGKHRGPAAAAILCIAAGSLQNEQAIDLMKKAGTGKNYTGLWRDVKSFVPPGKDTALPELVAIAKVEPLVVAMARLNDSFENIKRCENANWKAPSTHPDLLPAAEARLVQEGFHEANRLPDVAYDEEFRTWLTEADELSEKLTEAIQAGDAMLASGHLKTLEQKCVQCHERYRNQ